MKTQVKFQPMLILTHRDQSRIVPLSRPTISIGRSAASDIFICHGQVSRQQSVIRQTDCGKRFMVFDGNGEDLASRNGTYVNWEKVSRCYLEPEDVICFGSPAVFAKFCWVGNVGNPWELQPLFQKVEEIPTQLILPDRTLDLSESVFG